MNALGRTFVLFLLSLPFSAQGQVQPPLSPELPPSLGDPPTTSHYIYKNPVTGNLVIGGQAQNGAQLMVEADLANDTVTYSVDGASMVFSINEVAAAYGNGDAQKATTFANKLRAELASDSLAQIQSLRVGYQFAPPSGIPQPCDLAPCGGPGQPGPGPGWPAPEDGWHNSFFAVDDVYDHPPVVVVGNPDPIDRNYFDRWQADRCSAATSLTYQTMFGLLGSFASCVAATTPPFSLVASGLCIAVTGTTINIAIDATAARQDCQLPYPGPGNW